MENITKKTNWKHTGKNPLKLWHIKIEPIFLWELIWDLTKNQTFGYHETIMPNPHAKESEIIKQLFDYVDFRKKIFPMMDKICYLHQWMFPLHQYAFKFILHFNKFLVKLDNLLINKDELL